MIEGILISRDKKNATIHFDTHSVNVSSDTDVTHLVNELFIEPEARFQRSLENTAWIITLPTEDVA